MIPTDYYTSHCTTGKATTIRTLTRRAQLACDSPDSLQDRTDYLNNVFSKTKYNADSGRRNTHSNANAKTQANFNSGPVTTATISYFRGSSETITCILYLTTDNHFQLRLLTSVKDKDKPKTDKEHQMLRLPGHLH